MEDWWLLRKPLSERTVAANVLRWNCGCLNIDACRIGTTREVPASHSKSASAIGATGISGKRLASELDPNMGRWPANVVLGYPQDNYVLRDDITPKQRRELLNWMHENA